MLALSYRLCHTQSQRRSLQELLKDSDAGLAAFAGENGKRVSRWKFDVDEKCVRCWWSQEDAGNKTSFPRWRSCCFSMWPRLQQWLRGFNRDDVLEGTPDCIKQGQPMVFEARNGSIQWFMLWKHLLIRHLTIMHQRLPEKYGENLLFFQKFIIKVCREHRYILSQRGNANETPVWFDAPENMTVEVKGKKSVYEQMLEDSDVLWSIIADGRKLPPHIVFKTEHALPAVQFPENIFVWVREV